MTQLTSENVQAATSASVVTRAGGLRRLITIALFILLLIAVAFLLIKMNSLSNKLATLQSPSNSSQVEVNKGDADITPVDVNVKALEAAKYRTIAAKFGALNARVSQLKFSQADAPVVQKNQEVVQKKNVTLSPNSEMKWWSAVGDKVLTPIANFFKDLVKIQAIDDPEMKAAASGLAISPIAQSLLKQQVLTYLLSARQFVLLEMPKEALGDLQEVRLITQKNFAPQNPDTLAFVEGLNQIEADLKVMIASAQVAKPAEKK